jgi:hypothetical protein
MTAKLKGVAIRSTMKAIERLYGADGVIRVKAAMPERAREIVEHVLPVEWYPVEASAALHVAIRDVFGGGSWEASHALGVEAAKLEFTGFYKAVIRAVQYDTIWDRMERVWKLYNSTGKPDWFERGRGNARGEITGVAAYNEGVWQSVAGRCEGILILSGARGASVVARNPSSTRCDFEALWLE